MTGSSRDDKCLKAKIGRLKGLLAGASGQTLLEEAQRLLENGPSPLFRSTDVITISTLAEGRYVYVNDAFLGLSGYTREEVIGRTSLELGSWADPLQRGELVRLLRENDSAVDYEVQFRSKSGDILSAFTSAESMECGGEQYIVTLTRDVADLKRTLDVLQKERNKLRCILEAMEDGVCIISQERVVEYANPSVVREFGPVGGRRCYEYFHGTKEACPACRNDEVFDGRSVRWEWYSPKTRKTYDLLDIPMRNAAGRASKLEIFRDITVRKEAKEALRESEKRYRTLVETMNDGLVQGENGVINYVNDRFCEMLGYAREEIIGRELAGFLVRESQSIFQYQVDRIRLGELGSFEIHWTRKDGRKISTIASPKPVLDEHGQIKGCFAVIHDITERKSAEEELKNSYEQVRNLSAHLQSVREMERTNIAREIHDELGQALTALKMDISWISGKLRRDQKALHGKTRSMLALVDKTIKTVKRISAELRPGVLDDLGLTAAIEWQAREFRKRSGIPCDVAFHPPTIHPDKEPSTALFRIFQETLTNVARHAGATKVLARLEENDGEIVLTVVDNGKGITRKQILSPKSFGIIGIRERVNFFGGEVKITGNPKKGTALQVTIPRRRKEEGLSASFTGEHKTFADSPSGGIIGPAIQGKTA